MVRRLVFDIAWRSRVTYWLMVPSVGLVWTILAAGEPEFESLGLALSMGLALSIVFAYVLGPLVSVAMVGLREIRILPVTNRDLWKATWIVSAIVIPLAITTVQSLAVIAVATLTGSSIVSAEALFLSSLYCFAYAGALVPITPALGYSLNNMTTRRPRWMWIALSIGCSSIFVGGLALPFFIAEYLPLSFDHFSWLTASALVTCFVISAVSLAWTPLRGGVVTPVQPARKTKSTSRPKGRQRISDRLTGIPRIAWPFATLIVMLSGGVFAAFVVYWATFESGIPLRAFLQNNAVLLFDTGFLPRPDMGDMWVPLTLAFIAMSSPWRPFARQLKALPLTTHQINTLFLATPFAQWTLVWLALIAIHIAVVGAFPMNVRPDIFVLVGGISALGHVLMMRYGHKGSMWIVMLMGVLLSMARRLSANSWSVSAEALLIALGLVALVVAAVVNHRTLTSSTSSSRAYRAESLPFGISAPGARP